MSITTVSTREFDHNPSEAKRAAELSPVIITDQGKPAFVLISYAEYQRLITGSVRNIVDALSMPEMSEIEFDPPKADFQIRTVDFS